MKIAIPSNDGKMINSHFGRSIGFRVIEVEEGVIKSDVYLKNDFTGHAQGAHKEHDHSHEHHNENAHSHSHQGIFAALEGVNTVIAGGMGRRLYDEFAQRNVSVFVTEETFIDTAVHKYLKNELTHNPDTCCTH